MNTEDLIKLIKEDKKAIENRDGFTPLFALAENIAKRYGDVSPEKAEKLILSLDISLFNVDEINTLNGFIYYSKIKTDAITEKYFTFIRNHLGWKISFMYLFSKKCLPFIRKHNVDNLHKKGILMFFIIKHNPSKFSLENILKERALHKEFPWIWIDCITQYDWHSAELDICNLLTKKDGLKNLLCRLPLYKELDKKHDIKLTNSLDLWYNAMNDQGKNELKKWSEIFDIPFKANEKAEDRYLFLKIIKDKTIIDQSRLIPVEI
jgi:hypothetical protein